MTDAASRDYTWSVPNRRFIDSGLYLPSVAIIDTSGSLPAQTLPGSGGTPQDRGRDQAGTNRRAPSGRHAAGSSPAATRLNDFQPTAAMLTHAAVANSAK